ncbi:MAG: head-tail connector protein [Fimbriimonadaceae bacterium]|nr:head-tail connector protein [Alphaproteobacteria bacterium]
MTAILRTGPASEPVSLVEAKLHLRVDSDGEDTLIQSLLIAARVHLETLTNRVFITQSWTIMRDAWPDSNVLELQIGPISAVEEIRVFEDDDIVMVISPTQYLVDTGTVPSRIAMRGHAGWPRPGRVLSGIEIDVVAGYGPAAGDVPQALRQAILLLTAHWFENRDQAARAGAGLPVPGGVEAIVGSYRTARL